MTELEAIRLAFLALLVIIMIIVIIFTNKRQVSIKKVAEKDAGFTLATLDIISARLAKKNYEGSYDPPKDYRKGGNPPRAYHHSDKCRHNSPCITCKDRGH